MSRVYPAIILSSEEDHRRIPGLVHHMVVRRVGVQCPKLFRVLDRSKLSHVESTVRVQLNPKHIIDSHKRDHGLKQFRMLRQSRTHQQPTITTALNCQPRRARIAGIHQMSRTGDKVVENVLLPGQVPRPMPLLPVLTSTSKVGDRYDSSLVKTDPPSNPEIWLQANPITTIPAENRRVTTIQSHALT